MRRCSWLLLAVSACLVQDPQWEPQADTDAPSSGATSSTSGEAGGSDESGEPTTGSTPQDELPADCSELGNLPADAITLTPEDNADLHTIVANAPAGATIALEPGIYDRTDLPTIVVDGPGITIRSTTGDAEGVVIDGGTGTRLLSVQADDVRLVEFTIQNSGATLVDVGSSESTLEGTRIYGMRFIDGGAALLEVGSQSSRWTDDGLVACSSFQITDEFRDSRTDCSGLSGLRISGGARWLVRDNIFEGFWCSSGAYATLVADLGSSDTRIERNMLRNNYRGILFGGDNVDAGRPDESEDPCGVPEGTTWGHVRGIAENNVIWVDNPQMAGALGGSGPDLDSMLGFWHVCAGTAAHNTAYVTLPAFNGIEWRYPDTTVLISNNLVSSTLMPRNNAVEIGIANNMSGATEAEFLDPGAGDLRLVPGSAARDAGIPIPGAPVPRDYDGLPRVGRPDLGAFEFQP